MSGTAWTALSTHAWNSASSTSRMDTIPTAFPFSRSGMCRTSASHINRRQRGCCPPAWPHGLRGEHVGRPDQVRVAALGQRPNDVPFGHHSQGALAVDDDQRADTGGGERLGHLPQRRLTVYLGHRRGHDGAHRVGRRRTSPPSWHLPDRRLPARGRPGRDVLGRPLTAGVADDAHVGPGEEQRLPPVGPGDPIMLLPRAH